MNRPESLGELLERRGGELLQSARRLSRVAPMTTTHVHELIGNLLDDQIGWLSNPHPQEVKAAAKGRVHYVLDNGFVPHLGYSDGELLVWELVDFLGFSRTEPWGAQAQISALIDQYDLSTPR